MKVQTTAGELDESLLIKHDKVIENINEIIYPIEYCLKGCKGPAHVTGQPDSAFCFCFQHVHRSAHIDLKKGAFSEVVAGMFS
jgi:hypothetical protein